MSPRITHVIITWDNLSTAQLVMSLIITRVELKDNPQ